ncbi:hypothetical protein B0E38_06461 [Streptomyces sp. 111WW2]|uniref:hypothetical protein n=1 Tax=Streptomyces sp. 111WW2 TaxID=1945515 RepID=UPI000D0C96C1|nr:hypothetical protein [Streptomyces sp. 111WW2]PSK47984.1 hypothetical protein B0E38_06461 [Streptomyces sp. 111WW2]
MNTDADLKLLGVAEVNGRPLACAACGNTFSLEVHKRTVFETAAAWVCCLSCGHGGEDQAVTNGLVDAVLAGWANRQKDVAGRDQFTAEWRGIVLAGELVPTLDLYQAAVAVRAVHEGAKPHVKRWWRGKKRAAKDRAKAPLRAVKAKVTVAAVGAAWDMQTGGAGLPGKPARMPRCRVQGCRKGWVTITTRVHSDTGKKQQKRIRCAVCDRAG